MLPTGEVDTTTHPSLSHMEQSLLKIGELAEQTGITVRTLHHYDALGLVTPTERSRAGYRLYTSDDVARLQIVRSLQELGLSLKDIKRALEKRDLSFHHVIGMHLAKLKERIKLEQDVCRQLEGVTRAFASRQHVPAEHIILLLRHMNNLQTDFGLDDNERAALEAHWGQYSEADIKAVEHEWPTLIAQVRQHMASGTDPKDPAVQTLAKRWMELVTMFTGGNQKVAEGAKKNFQDHGAELKQQHGDSVPDMAMMEYIQSALK